MIETHLSRERELSRQLISLQVEDHYLRRADRPEVVDRRHHAAIYDPQSITPVQFRPVHGDQRGAVQIAFAGGVPVPGRVSLELRAALQRQVPRDVVQSRRNAGSQPRNADEDPVPTNLDPGGHHVLRTILIEEFSLVRQGEVQQRPLSYGFEDLRGR